MADCRKEIGAHRGKYNPDRDTPLPPTPDFAPRHAKRESRAGWHAWFHAYARDPQMAGKEYY